MKSKGIFKTSVGRKNLMALTGLFISFFLIIHLFGNLILILPDSFFPVAFWGGVANVHDMYNAYSHFLVHFWPVTIIAWILYVCIFIHIIDAILITLYNYKANGEKYLVNNTSSSIWFTRYMGVLGIIIGAFIVLHMAQFWFSYKVMQTEDNLYALVITVFNQWWYVLIYEIAIIALGFHLAHGISSAHRSLGIYHEKLMGFISIFAYVFAFSLTILYAIIPLVLFFK